MPFRPGALHPVNRFLRIPVHLWRVLFATWIPPCCRFFPSCSSYALDALNKHTWPWALWLIVRRVVCCNPIHPGGYDPVPDCECKRTGS